MNRRIVAAIGLALAGAAVPAAAQNNAAAQPAPVQTAPASPQAAPQPAPAQTPPVVVIPADQAPAAPNTVEAAPEPAAPAPEPMTISPDAAYPNGFADPDDPFGNDLSLARRDEGGGFAWGLLGLLGLLGLIPLFRRKGGRTVRTVYVDSNDPKRVIREESVEE